MQKEFSRRRFVEGLAATAAGVALLGCHSNAPSGPATGVQNPDGTVTVPGVGSLTAGQSTTFSLPNGDTGIVFVSAQGVHGAVDGKCTHAGCLVAFQTAPGGANVLSCPCHGSVFDLSGAVEHGPAKRPLTAYTVTVNGADAVLRKV